MKRSAACFFLFLTLAGGAAASAPQCVFERYTSLDGLPQNAISDIHKDSQGFVWLCTWYGLSRFDGYSFKNYLTLPGDYSPLSHNRFLRISEDTKGYLWLTTYDRKLYRFDRGSEQFVGIPHSLDQFRDKGLRVETYLNAAGGDTWIALGGQGLMRISQPDPSKPLQTHTYFDSPAIGKKQFTLSEDSQGRLWVASDAGVAVMEPRNGDYQAVAVSPGTKAGRIAELEGTICLIAAGELLAVDTKTLKPTKYQLPGGDRLVSVAASNDRRTLYLGTGRSGVGRFDVATGRITTDGRNVGRIRTIVLDSRGTLWLTTGEAGITRYLPATRDYKSFSQRMNVVSYFMDSTSKVVERNDLVWIKMNRVGFGYYDRERDEVMPFYNDPSLSGARFQNGVVCFTVDTDNVLWMSTQMRGLEKVTIINRRAKVFGPQTPGINAGQQEIRALARDNEGRIWAGSKDGGLFCYDSLHRLVKQYPNPKNPAPVGRVYAIFPDSRGDIWVGTKGDGLIRMQRRGDDYAFTWFTHSASDPQSLSHNDVYSITQDDAGRIWVATFGGGINLLQWDGQRARFLNSGNSFPNYPGEMRARYMLLKNRTTMLVATVEGLIVFDPTQNPGKMRFTTLRKIPGDHTSLGNNDVIHMFKDYRGQVWLSTFGGGLNLMRNHQEDSIVRFDIYDSRQGLSSNIVYGATADRLGNIWLSTENGISCFTPSTATFSNYSKYDGIPEASFNEATIATDSRGRVLCGGTSGIYSVDPDIIEPAQENYRLTFTALKVRNQEVEAGPESPISNSITEARQITLPYDYSIFRLEFAALNLRIQPRTSYMYRLEGHEKDWNIERGAHSATYSNLPAGNYTLNVMCYADDNPTQGQQIEIGITVLPPFWQTGWAWLAYIVVGLLLLWIVLRTLNTVFSLRQKVSLERQMTELKLGFFTNISHELRSPLTLILGGIDEVRRHEKLSARGDNNIRLAAKNAQRMLTMINQLLDFRKVVTNKMELRIAQTDMVQLARSVAENFTEVALEHNITFALDLPMESLMAWVDAERVESVIDNLLSNAFKFTPQNGAISLTVAPGPGLDRFTIRVQDNGVGISRENLVKIFEHFGQSELPLWNNMKGSGIGLSLCNEIVSLHKGRIDVDSRQGEGATFTVRLPYGNAALSGGTGYASDRVVVERPKDAPEMPAGQHHPSVKSSDVPTILVVEDNPDVRAFLLGLLNDSYHVVDAADGRQALDLLRGGADPDLIVTDLMMPEMDGIELTAAVREDFGLSHLPIIILTAKSSVESRISAMRYGADAYLTKPFNAEHLLASIENLLSRCRVMAEKYSGGLASEGKVMNLAPGEIVVTDRDEEFIRGVMDWIDQNIENPELTIDQLASHAGMGRTTMYKKLKSLTGRSPVELIKDYRLNRARMMLSSGQFTVSEAAYKVGFSDPSYFSKCFKEYYGTSPVDFLKNPKV